jgi:hypothetical protein
MKGVGFAAGVPCGEGFGWGDAVLLDGGGVLEGDGACVDPDVDGVAGVA